MSIYQPNLKKILIGLLIPFFVLSLFFIWKPLTLLFVPGILLLYIKKPKHEINRSLLFIPAVSLSFWMIGFWYLRYIPISLTQLHLIVCLATIIVMLVLTIIFKVNGLVKISSSHIIVFSVFMFVGVIRFIPMFFTLAPSGLDSSMGAYFSALINMANGVPLSYYPIFNIGTFKTFPQGLQILASMISLLSDLEIHRAIFVTICFVYPFLTYAIFQLLHSKFSWKIALISSLVMSFFLEKPQSFVSWGGNGTILAISFAIYCVAAVVGVKRNNYIISYLYFIFPVVGIFLTHTVIFISVFYLFLIPVFIYFIISKDINKVFCKFIIIIVVSFFVFTLPYIMNIDFTILSDVNIEILRVWIQDSGHSWHGTLADFYYTIPLYVYREMFFKYYGSFIYNFTLYLTIPTSMLGYVFLYKKNNSLFWFTTSLCIMCGLLIINSQHWILPFSYLVYPERLMIFILVPMSITCSLFFKVVISQRSNRITVLQKPIIRNVSFILIIFLLVKLSAVYSDKAYGYLILSRDPVTSDDIKGFRWLQNNITTDEIVGSNYGDSGIWIPAMAQRKCTRAHISLSLFNMKESKENISYVFIGSKCIYKEYCAYSYESVVKHCPDCKLVFKSNNTYIFKAHRQVESIVNPIHPMMK